MRNNPKISFTRDIKRGDIYYIESIYPSTGSEQRAGRPAIIVSNDANNKHSEVVEVVYLTTQPKKDLPTHVVIRSTNNISTALCEQIANVSIDRLGSYKSTCSKDEMEQIDMALMISLGIREPCYEDKKETTPVIEKGTSPVAKPKPTIIQSEPNASNDDLIRTQAQLEVYTKLYHELLTKLVLKEGVSGT